MIFNNCLFFTHSLDLITYQYDRGRPYAPYKRSQSRHHYYSPRSLLLHLPLHYSRQSGGGTTPKRRGVSDTPVPPSSGSRGRVRRPRPRRPQPLIGGRAVGWVREQCRAVPCNDLKRRRLKIFNYIIPLF